MMEMEEETLYGGSLEDKTIEELKTIQYHRHLLLKHLEMELEQLQSPTEDDHRVEVLMSAMKMDDEDKEELEPSEQLKLGLNAAKDFLADIKEERHPHLPLCGTGEDPQHHQYHHAAHDAIPSHPAQEMVQEKEQARKEAMKRRPDHPYIGNEGAFADWYQLRENAWSDTGFDTREMMYYSRPDGVAYTAAAAAESARDSFIEWEKRTSDRVSKTSGYQVIESKFGPMVPPCLKDGDAYVPIQKPPEKIEWGCGDVYVNLHREKQQVHAMQKQMAQAGIWAHGKPERVDAAFLLREGLMQPPKEPVPAM